eukprot:GEMP01090975.1.p1 GENE.GEMP01090975.1~~GEMP01090975.1.p1  ORF type:complete len:209 (-),score=47.83 GEMP01090975.1:295-900(-)
MPGVHVGCNCADEPPLQNGNWLLPWIDLDGAQSLNTEGDVKKVLGKSYEHRTDDTHFLVSPEDDAEILITIPFTSPVKLTSLFVIGGDEGKSPTKVRLFANRELDFDSIEDTACTQEIPLALDFCGAIEYPVRAAMFNGITALSLHFPEAIGAGSQQIFWIGLKGQGSEWKRQAVVTVYESQANVADHKVSEDALGQQNIR